MARVFISHADDGGDQAGEVRRWLVEEGHEVFLDQDSHDGIAAGEPWRARLHERLRWADVVVCIVTSAYRESRWCAAEVEIARSRGIQLLPLRAEPGVLDPALDSVQHIELARDPAAARAELITELRRVHAKGGGGWPDDRSPFPGLAPFGIEQQRVFFGRAEDNKELVKLLRSRDRHGEDAALLVVGPSGCGKSSLVRAGLLPVIADEPGWWALSPIVPGADPVAALEWELAAAARLLGLGWTVAQVRRQLDDEGLVGLVRELLLATPGGPRHRLLVVVDQAEELLTQTSPADRTRFIEMMRPVLGGPVQLVATLRSEFLDPLLSDPALGGIAGHIHPVRPLEREALRTVIEGPARVAGIGVDPELVDRLVEDTDTGDALPLLAFTLAQLADGVHRGGQLSATRYTELGGVQGALTRQAEAALATAVTATGRSHQEVISGLLRLVTVDEQGRPTRWRTRRAELPASVATELDAFVERRLLTTDKADGEGGDAIIGVAHEAFLSAWPPLRDAITASVTALRARRAVEHAATAWQEHGRPPARLWGGGQLAAAVADTGARLHSGSAPPAASLPPKRGPANRLPHRHRVLVTDRVDLSPTARDFLHTSIRRDRSRRRRAVTVLSVLLVLALIGAGIATVQRQTAQDRQRIATARQLIAQAEAVRDADPRTALQLGIAARHIYPGDETQASLVNLLITTPYGGALTADNGWVTSVAFSPEGRTLATASGGNVILWDLTDRTAPRQLSPPTTAHTQPVWAVAFSPDGQTLASADGGGNEDSSSGTVILWDVSNRTAPRQLSPPLTAHTAGVRSVAFSPEGSTLATAALDGTMILWDLTDRTAPRQLAAYPGSAFSVVFSPDRRTLATASYNGTVILWDVSDPAQPQPLGQPLTGNTRGVESVAFSPDGQTLATPGRDGTVILWDLTDRTAPRPIASPLPAYTASAFSVAFSPDGHTLAINSGNVFGGGTVLLWDLTDRAQPRRLDPPLTSHTERVRAVAFSPDGHTLATASNDGTAILWDLIDPAQPQPLGPPLTAHTQSVRAAAFSPDGQRLATASRTVILWDLADRTAPRPFGPPLTAHTGSVWAVAFSPNGYTLASADRNGTVILWDLADPTAPRPLGPPLIAHDQGVFSVAFSPDGRTLATASDDEKVILWDITDPTAPRPLGPPLTAQADNTTTVAFSPDGRTLATPNDETVILWDVTDRTAPRQLGAPLTDYIVEVLSVAFSPDGRILATPNDEEVILWDLTDRAEPRRLGPPLTGHTEMVWAVAFSPNGHTLATAGDDRKVILWDVTNRTAPRQLGTPLTAHTDRVWAVAFSPGRPTLATASWDNTVILWDLTSLADLQDHAVQRACSVTGRGLTPDEWERYISGLPYQGTCLG